MPIESTYPPITVPPVDLWTLVFERNDREFPEEHGTFLLNRIVSTEVAYFTG